MLEKPECFAKFAWEFLQISPVETSKRDVVSPPEKARGFKAAETAFSHLVATLELAGGTTKATLVAGSNYRQKLYKSYHGKPRVFFIFRAY